VQTRSMRQQSFASGSLRAEDQRRRNGGAHKAFEISVVAIARCYCRCVFDCLCVVEKRW
jgi:hypothetical protein